MLTLPACPRLARLAVTAAVALTALAGCSGDAEDPTDAPSATASADATASGDADPAAPREMSEDGLPVAFPRQDVPVLDGEVVSVAEGDQEAGDEYTVMVYVAEASPAAAMSQAVGLLADQGWRSQTTVTAGEDPGPQVLVRPSGDRVILTHTLQQGETALTYSVEMG